MIRHDSDVREPRAAEGEEMVSLMRLGVLDALRKHKVEGRSVVVWDQEAGQVVQLRPEVIVIPDETVEPGSA